MKNHPILIKFGTLHQILNPVTVTWPKIEIFKIQDVGGRHLVIRFFGHNSSTDCPISAKFRMRKQNGRSTRATWQKLQIFKIQHGGPPPFRKSLNGHISVKNRPILMTFGTLHQILNPVTATWPKIEIFEIQDGAMAAAIFLAFFRLFGHYSLTDCPISAKFCMRKQNGMLTRATGQKMQMWKIQDNGRPPFWKSLNRYISVKIWQILMKFGTLHHSYMWPKMKFLEFKMAANAILKFSFLVITHRPIVRFRRNFVCGSRTSCRQRPHDNKKLSHRREAVPTPLVVEYFR